jgi:hypothetical protein
VATALLAIAAGCTLPDVPLGPGDDLPVVEAVLRTDAPVQEILLHRTFGGGVGEPDARVRVTTAAGRVVEFTADGDLCFAIGPTEEGGAPRPEGRCYRSSYDEGFWVRPGETYELAVETSRGERLRGRTVVPGAFALAGLPHASRTDETPPACAIPAGTVLPIRWTQARGAWAYFAPLRIRGLREALAPAGIDAPEPLDLLGLSITAADTVLLLPSEFGVFDRFRLDQDLLRALQGGLPPGVTMELAVAAADRNYVNGVRGGSFNPSGQVRISSIAGDGVGVFGSLVPLRARIVVDPPGGGVPPCPAA